MPGQALHQQQGFELRRRPLARRRFYPEYWLTALILVTSLGIALSTLIA
ncbi:MAG: hypothetical protein J7493_11925 [Porphyrobacter sp.]|nr:hypothetical protein [Porphyrobacter sp.]